MASWPAEAEGLAPPPSPHGSVGQLVARTDPCGDLMSRAFPWFLAWGFGASSLERPIPREDPWVLLAVHGATWTQPGFVDVTCRMTPSNVSPFSACLISHPV